MKFSEMQYTRPDLDATGAELTALAEKLEKAENYGEAKAIFLEKEELLRHIDTLSNLVSIRHSIDTRDEFYDKEQDYWNAKLPELSEHEQKFDIAMLGSRFRPDFESEYGDLMFINTELSVKAFSPKIIPEMQKENDLTTRYMKLIASAQIPFDDGVYTLSQLAPFKDSADDDVRLRAWKAEGQWFKDNKSELDDIYDKLVKLRNRMGKKLGYKGYTELGYYRMGRNCYDKKDVEKFRSAVINYVVPVADKIFRRQAKRLKKEYPMSFADNALTFRSGNPKPQGSFDDTVKAGKKFYDELSPETSEFFNVMLDNELMDLLSTEGKEGGGYCTSIADYEVPFIFANFNGTQHDVEVMTHEAGHAFAAYTNRSRVPLSYIWPSMEACEVHSMSMEFMAWPWAEDFFGADARKYRYAHLADALKFIPSGTMVDHFQHVVYEHPEFGPDERHYLWRDLLDIYMPWQRIDGEIPVYGEGYGWQRQQHIYNSPFYYIDYCLAQTVSLEFWALLQEDRKKAWDKYMAYTVQGGTRTFTDLLKNAGLDSPFDEKTLKSVCEKAEKWLRSYDLTGIE